MVPFLMDRIVVLLLPREKAAKGRIVQPRRRLLVEIALIVLLVTFQGLVVLHTHGHDSPHCSHFHATAVETSTDSGAESCSLCRALQGSQADVSAPVDSGSQAPALHEPRIAVAPPVSPPVRRGGPSRAPPTC